MILNVARLPFQAALGRSIQKQPYSQLGEQIVPACSLPHTSQLNLPVPGGIILSARPIQPRRNVTGKGEPHALRAIGGTRHERAARSSSQATSRVHCGSTYSAQGCLNAILIGAHENKALWRVLGY